MCLWSEQARAYFEGGGRQQPAAGGGGSGRNTPPLALPYLIGLHQAAKGALDTDGWRRLRAATLRSAVEDHPKHGFSAIALPRGAMLTLLPALRYALRDVLGAVPALKLSSRRLQEVAGRRQTREARRKVEAARQAVLDGLADELRRCGAEKREQQDRELRMAAKGPARRDWRAVLRGPCMQCNGCSCYAKPLGIGFHSPYAAFCAFCGCSADVHEERQPGTMI